MDEPRRSDRSYRKPHRGDEVDLFLRSDLARELSPPAAAARVQQLRATGLSRLRVRVVKVPLGRVLAADDAVKVEAAELVGDTGDPAVYVRLEFLDLPVDARPRFAPNAPMPVRTVA